MKINDKILNVLADMNESGMKIEFTNPEHQNLLDLEMMFRGIRREMEQEGLI